MRTLDNIDPSYESLSIIRNIEIGRIDDEIKFEFKPLGFMDYHPNIWIWKNIWRAHIIKKVSKMGAVLTGSKALKNTKIDGKTILDRSTYFSDFDFLVTESILYDITSKIKFKRDNNKMSYRIVNADDYGHGAIYLDLIVVKELPNYHKVGEFLYADPIYILNKKYEGYLKEYNKNNNFKNEDLENFFWKFRKFY
jgi:hypothetical protein